MPTNGPAPAPAPAVPVLKCLLYSSTVVCSARTVPYHTGTGIVSYGMSYLVVSTYYVACAAAPCGPRMRIAKQVLKIARSRSKVLLLGFALERKRTFELNQRTALRWTTYDSISSERAFAAATRQEIIVLLTDVSNTDEPPTRTSHGDRPILDGKW